MTLYERDYYAWANETAEAIRTGAYDRVDAGALANEVADLARGEMRGLRRRFAILIGHLLKWDFQPEKRSRSWAGTVDLQRILIEQRLEDSPSLKGELARNLASVYKAAVAIAVRDTQLPKATFPRDCPYTIDEVLATKPVEY